LICLPHVLDTTVRSLTPFLLRYRMEFSGIPQIPNPPMIIFAPSLTSLRASSAEAQIFVKLKEFLNRRDLWLRRALFPNKTFCIVSKMCYVCVVKKMRCVSLTFSLLINIYLYFYFFQL